MADTNEVALAAVAKKQLGLPLSTPDSLVPQFYIDELRRHLRLCKSEINFRVTLEPKTGFGSVTCLKDGCNQMIPLGKRVRSLADGGKTDGFGSLSAYRTHLSNHKIVARPMRVNAMSIELPKEVVRQPPKTAVKSEATSIPLPSSTATSSKSNLKDSTGTANQKSTRKRPSDSAFNSENHDTSAPATSQVTKRLKTDLVPKSPLSIATNVATSNPATSNMFPSPDFAQDPLLMLSNVRAAIFGQQKLLETLISNPFKSPDDLQRILSVKEERQRLMVLEHQYQVAFLSMPSSSTASSHSTSQATFPHNYAPRPFSMEIDTHPPLSNAIAPPVTTAQASMSKQLPNPLARTSPVYQQASQAIAAQTLSTKQIPSMTDSSSDDDSSDYDSDAELSFDPSEFLSRIGIKAPLPLQSDAIDSHGNYYGRGHDMFEGPRASHDDLEKFLIQAGNADVFDGNERVEDALKYLGLKSLNDVIPGMEVSLMAHQALGVKWMVEKERSDFRGGCLADEMGLGKTVQMIATILKNRPSKAEHKPTLIVAPLALLDQWKTEIESKTNCDLACLIYHGSSKTTSKKKLLQYDIVLTTFNTLALQWPDFEMQMMKKKKARKNGENFIVSDDEEEMRDFSYRSRKRKEKAGLLFQVEFRRAILDEGQIIRNRRTRVSRAVTDIQATYRWCLTGTPIVNTLVDAYAYLRFLKIRPWYDWDEFNSHIARKERKKPELAITRLHAIMNTFLLRRQKNTKLDGKLIINLPAKEVKLVKLEFSKEEHEVYKMVEVRNQAIFNRYLRAGTVLKNYHHVLVLLLRLRQICSHPSLIAEEGSAYVPPEEAEGDFKLEFATELTRARRLVSEEFVAKMKGRFKKEALARMEAEKASADAAIEEEDCPICFDTTTDAVLTCCGHVFCRECIVSFINARPAGDRADRDCPCCREPLDVKKLFSRSAFEPTDKELNPISSTDGDVEMLSDDDYAPTYGKGKGKAVSRPKRPSRGVITESDDEDSDDDMSDFIVQSDEDEEEKDARHALKHLGKRSGRVILDSDDEVDNPEEKEVLFGVRRQEDMHPEAIKLLPRFLPSSKMKYMMDELERIFKTKPDEKVLVVSQWTSCLELVSNYLSEKGIPHVKYQGDMSRKKRDQAVQVFMSKEKASVMLMSLKCGGVGLNLTRANNVISLDLGWSLAVESQAFDRVHRLGQRRKVLVQRVVIADTVEDRILQMQERKKTFADGTLGEGSAKKMGKLSVKELANLFGLDARGRVLKD